MLWRLAFLSVLKHWRRSAVVLLSVMLATAVMVTVTSLLSGVMESFYDSVIPSSGHVRVEDPRAEKALNPLGLAFLLPDARAATDAILAAGIPGVRSVEPVLRFGALLVEPRDDGDADPRNLALMAVGSRPDTAFADNIRAGLLEGSFLPAGKGICLSRRAARLLGSGLGKGLLVLVQDRSGQPWYEELPVTGIFQTESESFDEAVFYVDHDHAAQMLDAAGMTREIRVLLSDRNGARAALDKVRAAVTALPGGGLQARSWYDIHASVLSLLVILRVFLLAVLFVFSVVAGTVIANTVLMSVFERVREFGTLRAIGLKAGQLRALVVREGLALGLAGAAVGVVLGFLGSSALSASGLDLGGIMESLGLDRVNHPRIQAPVVAACFLAGTVVCLAASAWAAGIAARKTVAESLAYL